MKKYRIKLNDKVYEVEVEEIENDNTDLNSSTSVSKKIEVVNNEENKNTNKNTNENINENKDEKRVVAPMGGTISGIKVSLGDKVKKGDTLLVLEAMKLENEISSPYDGSVSKILISKGGTVSADDTLIIIK